MVSVDESTFWVQKMTPFSAGHGMVLDMPDRWDTSVARSMPPTADDMATGNPRPGGKPCIHMCSQGGPHNRVNVSLVSHKCCLSLLFSSFENSTQSMPCKSQKGGHVFCGRHCRSWSIFTFLLEQQMNS